MVPIDGRPHKVAPVTNRWYRGSIAPRDRAPEKRTVVRGVRGILEQSLPLRRGSWLPGESRPAAPAAHPSRRKLIFPARPRFRVPIDPGAFVMSTTLSSTAASRPKPAGYVPALGPRLKKLLLLVLALVALLGANSLYLVAITLLEWWKGLTYQNYFYQVMFLLHLALGLLLVVPFLAFGLIHLFTARNRRNRRAVRVGYALFIASIVVLVSGLALMRIGSFDLKQPAARSIVYWLHVGAPLAAGWLYWLHRLAGPRIKWRYGLYYLGTVGVVVAGMVGMHSQDPRKWNQAGPAEGKKYFEPSLVKTQIADGGESGVYFLSERALMMDSYCLKCHEDAYKSWFHSSHRFSSFNNPAYLASVKETREVSLKRDGDVKASRWCAGCHDPVPFLSGKFDNPKYDLVNDPTSQAGITCTVCHAITHVNSTKGNADYTIEEPQHYPFAFSDNAVLQFINNQLVKAKPTFHKKTFLKPDVHQNAEFCSTCHKVHIPKVLNHYKEFLRGQDHYNSYLLSGVSGGGVRSFYYPPKAKTTCAECHMPLTPSNDFGAKDFANDGKRQIHNHFFPSANTGLAHLLDFDEATKAHQEFLKGNIRVDIFGLKEGGTIDGKLTAPLRPEVPALKPGGTYLLETVVRTLTIGHHFTQGTVDSNEVWVDVTVSSGGKVIGRNGGIDADSEVDPWSHFINVYMLDKDGNRIDRRNPQDIFTPLYNHQIPPGAGQVVHYELLLPEGLTAPVTIDVKVQYRKFDKTYMDFVTKSYKPGENKIRGYEPGRKYLNDLPVTTMAFDSVTFPVDGVAAEVEPQKSAIADLWQRWNDYGIGLFLEGQTPGPVPGGKTELKQAEQAFREVEQLDRFDGSLNLARVYHKEGRLDEAVEALARAAQFTKPAAPPWTIAYYSGLVNKEQGHLDEAIKNFRSALYDDTAERRERKFNFTKDFVAHNDLGVVLYERAKQERGDHNQGAREMFLREALAEFLKTIELDSENVTAHANLSQLYKLLGDEAKAAEERELHERYRPDDNAQDRAVNLARKKRDAANHAAEKLVIYPLHRRGAPGLPEKAVDAAAAGGGE
jgi:tetratricopeptide (TPR) repeat protein